MYKLIKWTKKTDGTGIWISRFSSRLLWSYCPRAFHYFFSFKYVLMYVFAHVSKVLIEGTVEDSNLNSASVSRQVRSFPHLKYLVQMKQSE